MLLSFIQFRRSIWNYYRTHKRHFPWRETIDPYHIVVSEIMLQQTQANRVVPKYQIFIKAFPDFKALAQAPLSEVLILWQGLGYNRRALALKKLSELVSALYKGRLPAEKEILETLPGIGKATAGSIAAFAFNLPSLFIETNIRRVFIHFFFPRKKLVADKEILPLLKKTLDRQNPREWYYALMDYGAMLAKITSNPNRQSRHYHQQSAFKGSHRQLRGQVLKTFLAQPGHSPVQLAKQLKRPLAVIKQTLEELEKEGFI